MGRGLSKVFLNENDMSFYVDSMMKGISMVEGVTERGPIGKATFISSWPKFVEIFGGLIEHSDFPLLCQRALARGAALWVGRVVHYADVTKKESYTAKIAKIDVGPYTFQATSEGAWGNDCSILIEATSDKDCKFFDVSFYYQGYLQNKWTSVSKDAFCDLSNNDIVVINNKKNSKELVINPEIYNLVGGDDGIKDLSAADYIGDQADETGFYMFDEVDDGSLQLSALDTTLFEVAIAGHAYCENRGDLLYVSAVPKNLKPQEALDYRKGKGVNGKEEGSPFSSNYGALYYPHLKVLDALTDETKIINPIGDILGVFAYSDNAAEEWFAAAGYRRGKINNCLGVEYNVGARAREKEGGLLVENQINPICVFEDAGTVVWGNETLQQTASALRDIHIRRLLLVMKKGLAKSCRINLFEPNDPTLWRDTYNMLNPYLQNIKERRGMYDYRLMCDQNAQSIDEATVNTPENIDKGEFRVQIWIKPTRVAKWIIIDLNIMKTGAVFADVIGETA